MQAARKSSRRRGSMPPPQARGGRSRNAQTNFRKHWTASGASSDFNTSENSPRKQRCSSSSRGSGTGTKSGTNVATDLSSPDLGVDLVCSDPFSSLERRSANAAAAEDCLSDFSQFQALMEENKRLKQDKERLSEKLTQSKGALRETLDRLHKKDFHVVSPMHQSSRSRIFSSAVAAAVSNKPPPPTLKEEFLAFSHSHALNKKTKISRQTSHEKQ